MADLDFLSLLEREVEAMASTIAAADPDAPVATCPGWAGRDLVAHVVAVHNWVRSTLGQDQPGEYAENPQAGGAAELATSYQQAAGALLQRMGELPPDTPTWTFDSNNRTAGYWRRRQLHEVSVHRFDLAPHAMSEEVAEDGLDEAVDLFVPRMVKAGRATPPEGTLQLAGPRRTWSIGSGEPVTAVQGSAQDLLLSLWGRGDLIPGPWRDAKLMP